MTQPLQIIDKIGYEDGSFTELHELPEALRLEVEQYNDWTEQLAATNKQLDTLSKQQRQLAYARNAAYSIITQAALQLQETKVKNDETSTQLADDTTDLLDSQDPQ